MKKVLFALAVGSMLAPAQDLQTRDILHLQADMGEHWFLPLWSITTLKSQAPDNSNIFFGVGYRGSGWWLENMVQKQWNPKGNQWMLDFRFDRQTGRWHTYGEATPFLTKKAFYEFAIIERQIWKGFAVGAETENTHLPGPDTVAMGPRLSRPMGKLAGLGVSAALAFRFDPLQQSTKIAGHPHEIRLYLVFNRRIARADK